MTYHLENTELVLEIARHRSRGRRRTGSGTTVAESSATFSRRVCLALFIGVAVQYVVLFSLIASVPWVTAAMLIARAPQSFLTGNIS
jgi:hypothetical protein